MKKDYSITNDADLIMYIENNFTFQLTNAKNEKNWDNKGDDYNISTIDLGKCEQIIKEKKGNPAYAELIILKIVFCK